MHWTLRQQAMLKAMGLRTWQPAMAAPAPDEAHERPRTAVAQPIAGAPVAATASEVAPIPLCVAAPPSLAQPTGFDAINWADLPAAVAGCQACGLCHSRQRTVPGAGQPGARWMIVSEAPDAAEEAAGAPGAGPAGQLLDNMLRAIGLSRDAQEVARQVLITPAVKCRPPRDRKPELAELAACAPILARQVALAQPRVILAMGKVAIRQVLGSDEPLGRLRGRVHDYRGTPVIATYDAAYLMRQPDDKAKAWEDLCLAAAVVAGTAPTR